MPDVNLDQGIDAANAQRTAGTSLITKQKADTQDYLTRYRNALAGQETQTAASDRITKELGLDKARGAATTLNTNINNLPGVLKEASVGRDINSNQLQRLTAKRLSPLQAEYSNASALQSNLEGALGNRLSLELGDQNKELQPYGVEQSLLQSGQSNEIGLFTSANANELNAINQKISSGVQISEGEKNRKQQLDIAKQNNDAEMARQTAGNTTKPNYVSVGEGSAVFDPSTGKMLYKNPKTSVAGSGTYSPSFGSSSDWS